MDRSTAIICLNMMFQYAGNAVPDRTLHNLVNAHLAEPVTREDLRVQLCEMKNRGWVDFRVDDFGNKSWFITPEGEIARVRYKAS